MTEELLQIKQEKPTKDRVAAGRIPEKLRNAEVLGVPQETKIIDEKKKAAMELMPMIEWENNSAENVIKIEKKV